MKNKKLKTLLPCCLLLVGGVSGLTACDGSSKIDVNSDDITVTFWVTFNDSYMQVIDNIITMFNQDYPNIHIDVVKQSGNYSALETNILQGIPADNYPNMALCYPDHVADYLETGRVVQMDDYMNDPEYGWTKDDIDDIFPNLLASGQELQVEGTWCLPFAASSEAMFYNDVLIGLDLSSYDSSINGGAALSADYLGSLTWEELIDHLFPALEKANADPNCTTLYGFINEESNKYYGLMGYDSDDNLYITLAEQYGYEYTSVDTATGKGSVNFTNNTNMKNLMKTFNGLYNRGTDDNDKDNLKYFTTEGTNGDNYTNSYFVNRGFLFSIGSTGGTHYQVEGNSDQVHATRIPQAEGHDTKCISQGPSIVFFDKRTKTADAETLAAWLFYKYLTNTQNTAYWGIETGYMPIRESAYYTDDWLDASNVANKSGEELTFAEVYSLYSDISSSLFTSPAFKGSSECRNQASSIMTQCLIATDLDSTIDKIFSDAENEAKLAM